jgi:hypothetical protein
LELFLKLSSDDVKEKIEKTEIKLKNLIRNKVKEDIWTLNGDSFLNVKYNIYETLEILPEKKTSMFNPNHLHLGLSTGCINEKPIICLKELDSSEIIPPAETKSILLKSTNKPKEVRFVGFNVPDTFKSRDGHKKNSTIGMDLLMLLGKKETPKTEQTSAISSLNISTLNLHKLDFEERSIDDPETGFIESFADYFFICGMPKTNGRNIPDSEDLLSCCKHKKCGVLRSYRPDILQRFPEGSNKVFNLCSSVMSFNLDF